MHEQFEKETRLPVNEPLARNIAIRHSNPENRWILSTNTDMIFVLSKGHHSLSEIARDLPNGFYETPRASSFLNPYGNVSTAKMLKRVFKRLLNGGMS